MNIYDLVVDNKSRLTDSLYSYESDLDLDIGQQVYVSFGKGKKAKRAFVFEKKNENEAAEIKSKIRLKKIESIEPAICLTEEIVSTAKWMRLRYGIKYIDAVKCFLPGNKTSIRDEKVQTVSRAENNGIREKTKKQELTAEQKHAYADIKKRIEEDTFSTVLIHGATGSGKTEVYMEAISYCLKMGKTAIMLLPEIALTEQITGRFKERFGEDEIAVMHSKLTPRERFKEWCKIRNGEAKLVIGARLAVFSPLEDIGLIVMDEEHEGTYKADGTPAYETVDIATKRLMHHKGVLVLGSATPSVVSYKRAEDGLYDLIEMPTRYNGVAMPEIQIVDMRRELKKGNRDIFSTLLYDSINTELNRNKQVILFLNRRGYSTFISCRDCGEPVICPDCGISLTYHKSKEKCICHYCGKNFAIPATCPKCGSEKIRFLGVGTEQVEKRANELFGKARIGRLDMDTARNKRTLKKTLKDFENHEIDILVGTQLIAKGLDFRNVSLVGVILADTMLNIPDYRSGERTFQLVTQVAGRCGRGDEQGKVVVQTYRPENKEIRAATGYDYKAFYDSEIQSRKLMMYPPFSDLIFVYFISESDKETLNVAETAYDFFKGKMEDKDGRVVYEPKLETLYNKKGSVRYSIMIKSRKGDRNKNMFYIGQFRKYMMRQKIKVVMVTDINPY